MIRDVVEIQMLLQDLASKSYFKGQNFPLLVFSPIFPVIYLNKISSIARISCMAIKQWSLNPNRYDEVKVRHAGNFLQIIQAFHKMLSVLRPTINA